MRLPLLTAAFLIPTMAFAAGSGDHTPPKTTKTSTECEAGQVFDEKTTTCVDKSSSLIDDDTRYEAVRELAYNGHYTRAQSVLDAMNPDDSRVLTYRGFIARKTGDMDQATVKPPSSSWPKSEPVVVATLGQNCPCVRP